MCERERDGGDDRNKDRSCARDTGPVWMTEDNFREAVLSLNHMGSGQSNSGPEA